MSDTRSYYGRPVIKEPTWTWEIPTYFFTGGLSGASSVLSLSARLLGNEKLARRSLYIGAVADLVSPPLLIADLGRPERFHHMLRVFKVTSPMNVGAWVLFVNGGASNTAAALELLGWLRPLKWLAELVSALSGPPLATYTGVLLADTAVPVWHEARQELPWIFGASAAASAGAAACMFLDPCGLGPGATARGRRRRGRGSAHADDGAAARRGRRGVPPGSCREALLGGEGAGCRRRSAARDPRAATPGRRCTRRRDRLRRRGLPALRSLQGGLPVGPRSEVHREAAAQRVAERGTRATTLPRS